MMVMAASELFGAQERVREINEEQHGHGAPQNIVEGHGSTVSKVVAKDAVADGGGKEGET
jgi:hypothetical protein